MFKTLRDYRGDAAVLHYLPKDIEALESLGGRPLYPIRWHNATQPDRPLSLYIPSTYMRLSRHAHAVIVAQPKVIAAPRTITPQDTVPVVQVL